MFVIGITGGVGSGKSLVAKLVKEKYNAGLLIADELGHLVMQPGSPGYSKIVKRFGEGIIGAGGAVDRKKLADIIFNDDTARSDMNSIIHPEVKSYIGRYINDRKDMDGLIILETAIMYETGCDKFCNEVWYVYVPADIRIKRLSENRGYPEEKSRSIIEKQKPDRFFMEKADRVIDNSGSVESLGLKLDALSTILQVAD